MASWPQRVAESWKSARTTLTDPDFWRQVQHQAPPWIDELGAILLIVLGVVSLTALFNTTSEAMLSVTLSRALRQAFGHGAYIVALSVLGAGIILLLPKFGITLRVGLVHVVGSEITFGAFEAMLHLFANDPEARALARSGGGGGYLGWALSQLTSGLGHTLSILIFGILFVAGLVLITGLRREHLVLGVAWMNARLQNGITRLDSLSFEPAAESLSDDSAGIDLETSALSQYSRRTAADPAISYPRHGKPSIVPRESAAEGSELAPSVTQGSVPDPSAPLATATGSDSAASYQGTRSKSKPRQLDPNNRLTRAQKKEIADKARQELGAPNGRSLVAPGEPGERPSIVPRDYLPDARPVPAAPRARVRHTRKEYSSRYFTVDDFQETKKIGRRAEHLPNLDLLNNIELNKPTEDEINTNARIIKHALLEFDVDVEVIDVKVGPTVTQYAVSPYTEVLTEDGETVLNRVRVSQIANLDGDLALALSAKRLRIQAPVPGHSYVGIEVPNRQPSTVALRPVLESEQFYQYRKRPLALPLGRDVSGESFITDLGTMPHLLIAGTTGSGKSIMLASITTAFVMNNPPDRIKLALLDPKMVELSRFNGLPHLLGPVETELDRIIEVLRWATREMEFRYKLLEKEAARNIDIYNKQLGRRRKAERLPYIVIIVDEIGDLMMQRPDETERALTRLAQMARAVGIHLMVATQRPSVDVITGLIKANFPARISFAVASGVDSRVILDSTGAETLMGRGDMLFLAPDASGPQRIQGCYVSDDEVNTVVQYWREWHENEVAEGRMDPPSVAPWERGLTRREVLAETDPMLEDAIALVIAEGEASASLIQRRLGLGYPRAARLIDLMHELGIVGEARAGGRTRNVLVKPGHDPFRKLIDERLKNKP
ncbi:MAG: DNA translocase FtsK [Anaerolineae bacterium]|nr:DNA translocase FtsK [Anaerolineae bacterium]